MTPSSISDGLVQYLGWTCTPPFSFSQSFVVRTRSFTFSFHHPYPLFHFASSHMKRAREVLLRDERERQEDELLRSQLAGREADDNAANRRKNKEEKFVDKWRACLKKWDAMELQPISARLLSLPVPDPPGRPPSFHFHAFIAFRRLIELGSSGTQSKRSRLLNGAPHRCDLGGALRNDQRSSGSAAGHILTHIASPL